MKDETARVKDAFDALELPADLNERTLQGIEAYAAENNMEFAPDEAGQPIKGEGPMPHRSVRRPPKGKVIRFFSLAACFVLIFAGVFGAKAYAEPTAYIDMDLNPSITLAVNRFDRVVSAEGLNDDGIALLEQVQVSGMTSTEAMEALFESEALAGYLDDDSFIELRVSCESETQSRELEESAGTCLSESKRDGSCSKASMEDREAAHKMGMGAGRYEMVKELVESDPSYDFEDCEGMSMREIRQHAAEAEGEGHAQKGQGKGHQGETGSDESCTGQGSGHASGDGQGNGVNGKGKHKNDQ